MRKVNILHIAKPLGGTSSRGSSREASFRGHTTADNQVSTKTKANSLPARTDPNGLFTKEHAHHYCPFARTLDVRGVSTYAYPE